MEVTTIMDLDRLKARGLPTDTYWLAVADTDEPGRALAAARERLNLLVLTDGEQEAVQAARDALHAAEAALKACYEPIELTALPPAEFEALVDAHPPRTGTDDDAWNTKTFPRACFLACAPKVWGAAEWEAFLDTRLSEAERTGLYNTALSVNVRVPDPTVPKDWMGTRD
jgi:hypothetical protein